MSTIIRLGNAQLRVIGLNPQRLSDESETRLPGHATFLGMAYQKTGTGEHSITLEVMTVPHILGGLDALGWLRAHHKAQDTVNYWRMETGGALPPVIMHRDPNYTFEANIEERPAHSETEGAWFDPLKGTFLQELASIGRAGGLSALMHPFASKVEAKRGAAAFAQQLSRFTGTGSFEGPGQAVALAGAPFIPIGYGSTIDSIEWVVNTVTHDIVPDQGWTMTVDVETREKTG